MSLKPFDAAKDYFAELKESEKHEGEYPLLKGLQRLAHTYRGGIRSTSSEIVRAQTDIAAVTFTVTFNDSTTFSGAADATPAAHKKPFNLHLVAVAESKAESRALRRAFNISKVAFEEIGQVAGDPDGEKITSAQLNGLQKVAERKGYTHLEVLKLIKQEKLGELAKLNSAQAREALKALNKVDGKNG